jgi:5-methylcytosine-specific restriction endonuclease McrA
MARHRRSRHYKKPSRRAARTVEAKARSMQTCWRRATNKTDTLSLEDAREIIENPPNCPYCSKAMHWRELSIDHVEPRSKGGADKADNLVWACKRCNGAKGDLNGTEFKLLMEFLDKHPTIKESVIPRLIAGGAAYGRRRR